MRDAGVDVSQQVSRGGLLDKLISAKVEQHLVQPTFLIDYPIEMSPLSKKKADNPMLVERFEGYAAGMEFCNAFTELNDPVDQRQRFEEQEEVREEFEGEETDRLDEDFPGRHRARDAAHRRAGAGNRPAHHAAVGTPEPARGRAVPAASDAVVFQQRCGGRRDHGANR